MTIQAYYCHQCSVAFVRSGPPQEVVNCPRCHDSFVEVQDFGGANQLVTLLSYMMHAHAESQTPQQVKETPAALIDACPFIKLDDRAEDSGNVCAICQEPHQAGEVMMELPCKHFFHPNCIVPWLKRQTCCPVCRKDINAESVESAEEQRKKTAAESTEDALTIMEKLPILELRRQLKINGIDDTGALEKQELISMLWKHTNKASDKSIGWTTGDDADESKEEYPPDTESRNSEIHAEAKRSTPLTQKVETAKQSEDPPNTESRSSEIHAEVIEESATEEMKNRLRRTAQQTEPRD